MVAGNLMVARQARTPGDQDQWGGGLAFHGALAVHPRAVSLTEQAQEVAAAAAEAVTPPTVVAAAAAAVLAAEAVLIAVEVATGVPP